MMMMLTRFLWHSRPIEYVFTSILIVGSWIVVYITIERTAAVLLFVLFFVVRARARARVCVCMCVHLGHSYDVRDFSEDRASLCETIVPEQLDLYEADVVTTFSRLDSHSTSGSDGLKGRTLKNCAAQLGKIFILEI